MIDDQLLPGQAVGVGVEGEVGVDVVAAVCGDGDGAVDVEEVVGDEADAGVVTHIPGQVVCETDREKIGRGCETDREREMIVAGRQEERVLL